MLSNRVKILLTCLLSLSICYFVFIGVKIPETIILNEARNSFVKIIVENEVVVTDCTDFELMNDLCDSASISSEGYQIFGSGIIINRNNENYILTANHICAQMIDGPVTSLSGVKGIMLSAPFAMTLDGMLQKVDIVKQDAENDLCLLDFERSTEYTGINIYNDYLIPGERVYNLAAPRGVFQPGNVLIFEGFYTGINTTANNSMTFSVYAEEGSSGSAIINNKGELVSIVHSTLTIINNVALGSSSESLREFLKDE